MSEGISEEDLRKFPSRSNNNFKNKSTNPSAVF